MTALVVAAKILVVLFSVVIHEVSHGYMAYSLGDSTAKNAGRLTLNPFKHLDFFGSVLLPLFLYFFAGFVFGYAKPVPYNPYHLKGKNGPAKVGFAGPASNIVIALAFGIVFRFLPTGLQTPALLDLLSFIVLINLILAIFNLVPIPPLDGHWLLLTFLPDRFYNFKRFIVQYGLILFLFFLIFIFPFFLPLIFFLFRLIVGG